MKRGIKRALLIVFILIILLFVGLLFISGLSLQDIPLLFSKIKSCCATPRSPLPVIDACNVACVSNSTYNYCALVRKVYFSRNDARTLTCKQLEDPIYNISLNCPDMVCPVEK